MRNFYKIANLPTRFAKVKRLDQPSAETNQAKETTMSNLHKYTKLVKCENMIKGVNEVEILNKLPPGMYTVEFLTSSGEVALSPMKTTHDELLQLPGTEYDQIVQEMELFLTKECRTGFKDLGYMYKNSWLLYGRPGTGKTCIANRLAQMVIERGGIALFNPLPAWLEMVYHLIDQTNPGMLVLTIFEEIDDLVKHAESTFLNILDGEVQRDNTMYVATTNYINKIPKRILRPRRFASVIEVKEPSFEARTAYLIHKLGRTHSMLNAIIKSVDGLTIDEIGEVVRSVVLLKKPLAETIERIRTTMGLGKPEQLQTGRAVVRVNGITVGYAQEIPPDEEQKNEETRLPMLWNTVDAATDESNDESNEQNHKSNE